MKLNFENEKLTQPDPFIYEEDDRYYIYATNINGVQLYTSDSVTGPYKFEGFVFDLGEKYLDYWAPCIIKLDRKYYLYFSSEVRENPRTYAQRLFVAESDSPYGPFTNPKQLYDYFSIDAHVVKTSAGLFLWYAVDVVDGVDKAGTRVCIDRLIDPYTPAHEMKQVVLPSLPEERSKTMEHDGRDWYTVEGPFWFEEDGWQYLMFSGACFENDTYHLGYAAAKSDEADLTKVDFVKHTLDGKFDPLIIKNEVEEGTGHHSLIKINGQYYVIYHGRDYTAPKTGEQRTARIARLVVDKGTLKMERM